MSQYSNKVSHTSWGRIVRGKYPIASPHYLDQLDDALNDKDNEQTLAIGLSRSYGDSALNSGGALIDMSQLNRIISFDSKNGILHAEAGASISDILQIIVPKGWFLKTTPGTRFVTLGGAIANDVHGKNHHKFGTIGCSVKSINLLRSNKEPIKLSKTQNKALFNATIGGLGLTGIITSAELELTPINSSFLNVERIAFEHVSDFFALAKESEKTHEHTVAWIDCSSAKSHLGRGIFQRANWCNDKKLIAHNDEAKLSMPVDAPNFALNGLSVKAFNAFYYRAQKYGYKKQRLHYAPFFYPLDSILNWNRLYGNRGFYQYQCVIPSDAAPLAIEEMLEQITKAGAGSFLAVLKTLGEIKSPGLLSFPMKGATLALDFPNNGEKTLKLLSILDELVKQAGGKLYPAKDGRMSKEMFEFSYPSLSSFKKHIDPALSSNFWKRIST